MRWVELTKNHELFLRWTWLPYWIAASPQAVREVQALLEDAVIINGLPLAEESSLDRISAWVQRYLVKRFADVGNLSGFLRAAEHIDLR
jgi:hypothetical protein